jgi:hypothetical protein
MRADVELWQILLYAAFCLGGGFLSGYIWRKETRG